jgi:ABC-2 type transport system permease protein
VAGIVTFGTHPLIVPAVPAVPGLGNTAGFELSTSALLVRVAIGAAYIAFGFTALLGLGTFFSTLTDTPTGAIGATVGVYIVSEILDGISQLGTIRYGFPTHYLDAWEPMLTQNQFPRDMIAGIGVQVAYIVAFFTAAVVWFKRKDIPS